MPLPLVKIGRIELNNPVSLVEVVDAKVIYSLLIAWLWEVRVTSIEVRKKTINFTECDKLFPLYFSLWSIPQ